jgi:hypothetical protein
MNQLLTLSATDLAGLPTVKTKFLFRNGISYVSDFALLATGAITITPTTDAIVSQDRILILQGSLKGFPLMNDRMIKHA